MAEHPDEIIDRVAQALRHALHNGQPVDPPWNNLTKTHREEYRRYARAAAAPIQAHAERQGAIRELEKLALDRLKEAQRRPQNDPRALEDIRTAEYLQDHAKELNEEGQA